METTNVKKEVQVINAEELLTHLKGHRKLTRRTIEIFPEEQLFTYSIGGMRSFAELIQELLGIAAPGIKEIATGNPAELQENFDHQNKKANLLEAWDKATVEIEKYWLQIEQERFQETIKSFGQYEGKVWENIFYFIDNEIHHRAQAFVYLRALGIDPPFFWDR
ncbi:damage-inducible protein DinB [Salegentibacter salinarum]|uniref:Damage-inducible protein DinB n=1 Tax=Salegentibacter salinarum TaxID=447422 RepID=A0A2N0TR37_9FLAO|nr:DinB family protein [Salegentibacter salinarum]PKD17203.1 damage-inducible protein DinB [Salegentibacter salinarum]SKB56375.1 Uncharacterized damage-inducible protein DinB (forms a four-helix bundle) [Salegentibacter salinarum]